MNEETEKNFAELLSEELKLREAEALENHRRADISLLEAKKMTSQYQKEADKCNSGMETCEAARERAEATLASQKRLTTLWETRARQRGWRDDIVTSRGTVQTS
ncbi:plant/T7A14-6 protein [Cucumis melo var. makuwa]|nr:plant/T7A14-6 protein [Cucumis melo var. makuwa]TYK09592.1 plant/T7A14-6 protein [Cucumis melo var. makuwa]